MATSTDRVRKGLGLICFGIVISFLMSLVSAIYGLVSKSGIPQGFQIAEAVVILVSIVAVVLGIIKCLLSGERHFTKALLIYIGLIITLIVLAALNDKLENHKWVWIFYYVFLALAHLSILRALKEVSLQKSGLNTCILSICILLFLAIAVIIILIQCKVVDTKLLGVVNILSSIESVAFFIGIFTTYLALR